MGNKSNLSRALSIIKEDGPPRGLYFRPDKSKVWCLDYPMEDKFPLGPDITRVDLHGIRVLGSPVGSVEYSKEFVESKISDLEELLENLHVLEDPHSEFSVLRNCFSLPKFSYITRTIPPGPHLQSYQRFNQAVRHTTEGIIGTSLSDSQWKQASLPVSMGGLGLRSAMAHAPGAYLVSVSGSDQIIKEITGKHTDRDDQAEGEEVEEGAAPVGQIFKALHLVNSR